MIPLLTRRERRLFPLFALSVDTNRITGAWVAYARPVTGDDTTWTRVTPRQLNDLYRATTPAGVAAVLAGAGPLRGELLAAGGAR